MLYSRNRSKLVNFYHFQNGGAKDGFDMNINPAWQKGYTGKGVVVSILDDGIQTNHPDLALNYVSILLFFDLDASLHALFKKT